jgi:co-chaperonin GroES (HSP10)
VKTSEIVLHRDDLILVKYWDPEGLTDSGLWTAQHTVTPQNLADQSIFGDVVLVPDCLRHIIQPGAFIVFEKYAGTYAWFDEGAHYFLHIDDVALIIPEEDEENAAPV